ncbi:hypothetical protein AK830_g10163 [Neonectria ditissima]|uniref:Calcineurin-like phosphoesterase domain-containing protein n=1 Tax=Neonectria ditissima TaxID=78410 RepID=A0A0N8H5K1_9HYPO|nr:hypothetical protein AK830_g10163 [Neonectria ditissima]
MTSVKTRFLILSDTHGTHFCPERHPHHRADVAIHCGDLTEESKIAEFRASLQLLKSLDAPLKLVIAGNHDFTLDIPMFKKKVADVRPPLEPGLVEREYGAWGEVKALFDDAKNAGVVLENGAALTVFASPFTPSLGDWGFQYHPQEGHDFPVKSGTDIFITHGPPKGIMDLTNSRKRAGCPDLFAAAARQRPKLHCFGHIHEGWGAKLVTWREKATENPSHFSDIDNDKSILVQSLAGLRRSKYDDDESAKQKADKLHAFLEDRCCRTSHCLGDENPLQGGKQTLFVNAAIQSDGEDEPPQLPWLVDIELQLALKNTTTESDLSSLQVGRENLQ